MCPAVSLVIEARLDHGQVGKVFWQPVLSKDFTHHRQVAAGALQPGFEGFSRPPRVVIDEVTNFFIFHNRKIIHRLLVGKRLSRVLRRSSDLHLAAADYRPEFRRQGARPVRPGSLRQPVLEQRIGKQLVIALFSRFRASRSTGAAILNWGLHSEALLRRIRRKERAYLPWNSLPGEPLPGDRSSF